MGDDKVKKAEKPKQDVPAEKDLNTEGKRKKLSRFTLDEIEKALVNVQAHMGGHDSAYARMLLERRKILKDSK